ncbi:DUF6578 domain-containing protein [Spongiactinospora sp. TRM90649]|uniref:DUF6578 domain-containing protein n=1 Tax=Spongiactinospora sp. TRM90649 TaxID=3031114 RepID=UPI0023F97456|nr:DUF6578 domain-containing protein [Spongiactinospora sp. TRM90649]MDF5757599.1 hypothetical protein [Spongiactinospora sp. TRM90649]
MEQTIWLDAWQMHCCGRPFRIGSTVSWRLFEMSSENLSDLLGRDVTVHLRQESHDTEFDRVPYTEAVVTAIGAVHCRYALGEDGYLRAQPGSGVMSTVDSADGYPAAPSDGMEFVGYLVTATCRAPAVSP